MPKRSAPEEADGKDAAAAKKNSGKQAAKQVGETHTQHTKKRANENDTPLEAGAKRLRHNLQEEQHMCADKPDGLGVNSFEAELNVRRKMKAHKSIVRRALAEKFMLASFVNQAYTGCFFSCIHNQILTLDIKAEFPFVDEAEGIPDLCIEWLQNNKDTHFSKPAYTAQLPSLSPTVQDSTNKTPRSTGKSKTVQKMMTDTFFEDLREECPAVNSLALFGCCNALKARIVVLLPATANRLKWEVWEPLNSTADMRTLFVARVQQHIYESLLEDDGEGPPAPLSSDDEAGDDDIAPTAAAAVKRVLALNGTWVQCTNVHCQKVRYVFEAIPEGDQKTWTCDQNVNASCENQCSDADIWNQINSFWSKGSNKDTAFRLLGRKPLQMSELFIAVQVVAHPSITPDLANAGAFAALKQHGKTTELSLKLGGEGLQRSSAAAQLKRIYEEVFVALRSSGEGGGNLEHLLLQQEQVQNTIAAHTNRILGWLNIERAGISLACPPVSVRKLRSGALPVVYQKSAQTQLSTENLHHMLQNFMRAAAMFPQDACLSPMIELRAEVKEKELRGGDLKALMLHGTTGVGKSQITDLLLMISEGIDSEYGSNAPPDRAASTEASRYLDELVATEKHGAVTVSAPSAAASEGTQSPWTDRVFVVDSAELEKFVSDTILRKEWSSKHTLSSWSLDRPDRPDDLSEVISYVLPVGDVEKMHNSTTACAVSIAYADTFQVVLEYRSEEEVLGQWRRWSEVNRKLDDDDDELTTNQRRQLEKEKEAMVEEVKRALATMDTDDGQVRVTEADEDDAKEFLESIDLDKTPELSKVLGARFGLIGAGDSAIKDRIFARRVLHYAQGMPDPTHDSQPEHLASDAAGASDVPEFLQFGNNCKCLLFGKRTGFALKQLTVFLPCAIAPQRGSGQKGWFDPCGLGDADILKEKVFSKSASEADAVLVVMKDTLKRAGQTFHELNKSTQAMVDLVKAELNNVPQPPPRMFLATNFELNYNSNAKKLLTIDELSSEKIKRSKIDHRSDNLKFLKKIAEKISKDSCEECGKSKEEAAEVAAKVSNGTVVPSACPTIFLFASLVLNTNYEKLSFKERLEKLEMTECYPMLGFIERVLQGSKHDMVLELKASAESHLKDLKDEEARLHKHGQPQSQNSDVSRAASRGSASRLGKKEYMQTLDSKLKGKPHFKELNEVLRRRWNEFVDEYSDRITNEWPGKEFVHKSQWCEVFRSFLRDCDEAEFNPFDPAYAADAQLQGESSQQQDLVNVDVLMRNVWTSGSKAFADRLGKALVQSSFATELSERFSSLAKECAHEIAEEVGTKPKDEQLGRLEQAVKAHVKGKLKTLGTDLKDYVRPSDAAYVDAVTRLRTEVWSAGSSEKRRDILLGKNKQMGSALQNFVTAVRSHFVQKLKKAFESSQPHKATDQDRLRRQRSGRGPSSGSSYREVLSTSEVFSIGDKFLGMLGLSTKWTKKAKKGNTADVSRWLCSKVLEEVNPWAYASRANDRRKQFAEAAKTVTNLIEGLEATLQGWKHTATDMTSMGKQMTQRFMALRQAEDLANKSETGLSILSQSKRLPRVDTTAMKHDKLRGGYVLFDFDKDLVSANAEVGKWRPQTLQKCSSLANEHDLKLTGWNREEADKDSLFNVYGQLLGMTGSPVVKQMRLAVAQMALRDKANDSKQSALRLKVIEKEHGSLEDYVSGMQSNDSGRLPADITALTYLVDYFERPLNLYTSLKKNPLRIMPHSLQGQELDYREADAFLYLGWAKEFQRARTSSSSEGDGASANDEDRDADLESPHKIFHFARCTGKNPAVTEGAEDLDQESPTRTAGWSLIEADDDADQDVDSERQIEEGWGLLEYRLKVLSNYQLHEEGQPGACAALAHQIRVRFGSDSQNTTECTHLDVKKDVAKWLRENSGRTLQGGAELSSFLRAVDGSFDQFCDAVQDGTETEGGHPLTLIAAANVYEKSIRIWSTNLNNWWLEIHPEGMSQEGTKPYFELGHCDKAKGFRSLHERYDSVTGLLPNLPPEHQMSFTDFVAKFDLPSKDGSRRHMQVDSETALGESDDEEGEGEEKDGVLPMPATLQRPDDYRYATFNPMSWIQPTASQPYYTWKGNKDFRLSRENFQELASRYAGFTERWCFQRGKKDKDYSGLNRPDRRGCTLYHSCDDAISHLLGCVAVFDGIGEGEHSSGSFARLLAKHVADISLQPVPGQDVNEEGYNRSLRLLRIAHGPACTDYKREHMQSSNQARLQGKNPSTTTVILTLIRQAGRTMLHWLVHGDSQWALLRRESGGYVVKHFSEATVKGTVERSYRRSRNSARLGTVTLDLPYQINLSSSSFEDDKPSDSSKMTGCIEVHDGDMIVAGSDGFFDNFGDQFGREKPKTLEALCNEADKRYGKAKRKGYITETLGTLLKDACLKLMENGACSKRDDVTLFVGKVSLKLRPGEERRTTKGTIEPWHRENERTAAGREELAAPP